MRGYVRKIILFSFCSLIVSNLKAQISVGLRESALGNSGAAITDSSAPSFYNPALLSEKQKSYFSLTGTTLSTFKSSTESGDFNSTKLAPNYLSNIHSFESYVHEFSLVNQISIDSRSITPITNGSTTSHIKSDLYALAYSFAFKDFPFGFQLGLRIYEQNFHINETQNDGNIATGINWDIAQKVGRLFTGFGGIHQIGEHYRFGYKYETQGLKIYKKTEQNGSYYIYDKTNNTFTTGKSTGSADEGNFNTQIITLGHSFVVSDHEFLTDSRFNENSEQKNKYSFSQTFGYKLNFSNKLQFMAGTAYEFDTKANYFSSGFSWQTNTLRSTICGYLSSNEDDTESTGITFGSEFIY